MTFEWKIKANDPLPSLTLKSVFFINVRCQWDKSRTNDSANLLGLFIFLKKDENGIRLDLAVPNRHLFGASHPLNQENFFAGLDGLRRWGGWSNAKSGFL